MEAFTPEILTVLATTVAAFWGAYKWLITRPKEKTEKSLKKADEDLKKIQLELKKHRIELEKEFPYVEFDFTIDCKKQDGKTALLIDARATNKGKRTAVCVVNHKDILTVAEVKSKSEAIELKSYRYAQYLNIEEESVDPWSKITIVPEAVKHFPVIVFVDSPGIYHIQIKLRMDEEDGREVRKKYNSDPGKPVYWSGSTYLQAGH